MNNYVWAVFETKIYYIWSIPVEKTMFSHKPPKKITYFIVILKSLSAIAL